MLELWVSQALSNGLVLTGDVIRKKWRDFADLAGIPTDKRLSLSDGWLACFKKRNGLREFKRHGEAGSADLGAVAHERNRIQKLLEEKGYNLKDIFNMDETGLFYAYVLLNRLLLLIGILTNTLRMPPDRGLSDKQTSGVKGRKVRLTFAFTTNADGSEKRPPIIIGKFEKPRCFKNKSGTQLGYYYRWNAKAWMTAVIYQEWLERWDLELRTQNRKVVLLQDNFSGHIVPDDLQNITVINFEPNLTSHIQPLDQGIIRCFKAHYRRSYIDRAIDLYENGVTPSEIYNINQLEAMQLARSAWDNVDVTTIRHCWRKADILPTQLGNMPPTQPHIPISSLLNTNSSIDPALQAEQDLESSLDLLESTGVLHKINRMSLETLLNPEDENSVGEMESDQEIFDAVMEVRRVEQMDNRIAMPTSEPDDGPTDPIPTRRDFIQAQMLINRFLAHADHSPLGQQLENALRAYSREVRAAQAASLKDTHITDFFARK